MNPTSSEWNEIEKKNNNNGKKMSINANLEKIMWRRAKITLQ